MQQKFTLTENEQLFLRESSKKMPVLPPKVQILDFIKQFACVYHTEGKLPSPLAAMILN